MIDVARARRETPGCAEVIHFDNAGAALMPVPVLEAMVQHLELEAEIGGYRAAAEESERVEAVYESIAVLLNCHVDEVAVVENATRAWDMAFYSLSFSPGDRILTTTAEYASNYLPLLQVARRTGALIEVVPSGEDGQVSIAALENMVDDRVKLISLTHVPTNGGLVNPAAEVGRVAREAGVPFLLDACQSVGQMPVDVEAIGCDFLSATARKFLRGPRGIGFLYVRRAALAGLEPPFLDLRAATWTGERDYRIRPDARRFENWEANYAAKLGLGAAVDYALGWGLSQIGYWVAALADVLRSRLESISGVTVRDLGTERCGIVTFTVDGMDPVVLKMALEAEDMNVAVSTRAATYLDMTARGLDAILRASVHYYNTEQEISRFCSTVERLTA